ncbi:hypothetical protein D1007_56743 [Hordeum vulgare]|nr:hypothetical protein D1007_56743 [Hordeum vulgare]
MVSLPRDDGGWKDTGELLSLAGEDRSWKRSGDCSWKGAGERFSLASDNRGWKGTGDGCGWKDTGELLSLMGDGCGWKDTGELLSLTSKDRGWKRSSDAWKGAGDKCAGELLSQVRSWKAPPDELPSPSHYCHGHICVPSPPIGHPRSRYPIRDWKHGFFFLASATPWPCPVDWGEPSRSSFLRPVLSGEEKKWAAKLLRAHGAAPVDVSTLLCDNKLAAATMVSSPVWPPPSCIRTSSTTSASSKGMDPSVYDMMKTMLADKVAAAVRSSASAKKVKAELLPSPLGGKKRSLDKANGVAGPESSVLRKNPPAAADVCSVPPTGDLGSPQHFTSRLVHDSTERVIAASRPSYTLELEEKLQERRAEITALRKQLEEYNNTVKDMGDKERGGLRDEHQAANKAANRRDAFFLLLVVFLG